MVSSVDENHSLLGEWVPEVVRSSSGQCGIEALMELIPLALFLSKSFTMGRHMRVTCLCSLYVHSIYAMCIVPIISNCNLHVTVFHLYHKRPCRAEVNGLSILDDYARNPEVISQRRIIYKRIRNCKYVKFNSLYEKIANKEKQY